MDESSMCQLQALTQSHHDTQSYVDYSPVCAVDDVDEETQMYHEELFELETAANALEATERGIAGMNLCDYLHVAKDGISIEISGSRSQHLAVPVKKNSKNGEGMIDASTFKHGQQSQPHHDLIHAGSTIKCTPNVKVVGGHSASRARKSYDTCTHPQFSRNKLGMRNASKSSFIAVKALPKLAYTPSMQSIPDAGLLHSIQEDKLPPLSVQRPHNQLC